MTQEFNVAVCHDPHDNAVSPKPTPQDERVSASPIVLTDEQVKARSKRNVAIALSLAGFAVLVFVVTLVRLGANVADRTF